MSRASSPGPPAVLLVAVGCLAASACGGDVPPQERYAAQPTPELAWARFIELNQQRVKQVDLGIYDEAAKNLVRKRNEDAGQDHIARLYRNAEPVVRTRGDRAAVVFLDDPAGTLAPWFFRRSGAGWQLDGHTQFNVVGYDGRNRWRFRDRIHPYMFAFADFRFDARGYGRSVHQDITHDRPNLRFAPTIQEWRSTRDDASTTYPFVPGGGPRAGGPRRRWLRAFGNLR